MLLASHSAVWQPAVSRVNTWLQASGGPPRPRYRSAKAAFTPHSLFFFFCCGPGLWLSPDSSLLLSKLLSAFPPAYFHVFSFLLPPPPHCLCQKREAELNFCMFVVQPEKMELMKRAEFVDTPENVVKEAFCWPLGSRLNLSLARILESLLVPRPKLPLSL